MEVVTAIQRVCGIVASPVSTTGAMRPAYTLGLTLVTDNTKAFSRIRGLAIENWLDL